MAPCKMDENLMFLQKEDFLTCHSFLCVYLQVFFGTITLTARFLPSRVILNVTDELCLIVPGLPLLPVLKK